jgi:hypothetical protein
MEEGDEFIGGTFEGDFVDEARALFLGLGELAGDVGGGEGDVVNAAGWVFLEKLGDGAIFGSGFEQLDMDVSSSEEGGSHFLGFDFLASLADEAEDVFVVGDGFFERSDGDAEVVDFSNHRAGCGLMWLSLLQDFRNQHRRDSFRLCVSYAIRARRWMRAFRRQFSGKAAGQRLEEWPKMSRWMRF